MERLANKIKHSTAQMDKILVTISRNIDYRTQYNFNFESQTISGIDSCYRISNG